MLKLWNCWGVAILILPHAFFWWKKYNFSDFQVYESCTFVADSQPWCATRVEENGHLVSNDWGYCSAKCPVMSHNPCRTVEGGPVVGAFCRFPFRYKDVEYNLCTLVDHYLTPDALNDTANAVNQTQGWCATKVDVHGDYVPHHWGICQPECKPPKSMIFLQILLIY